MLSLPRWFTQSLTGAREVALELCLYAYLFQCIISFFVCRKPGPPPHMWLNFAPKTTQIPHPLLYQAPQGVQSSAFAAVVDAAVPCSLAIASKWPGVFTPAFLIVSDKLRQARTPSSLACLCTITKCTPCPALPHPACLLHLHPCCVSGNIAHVP